MKQKTIRIGVDIGGTFTDFVLHDEARGLSATGKRLTTPDQPGRAIVEGIVRLLAETNSTIDQIHSIVHGTTLITNTVLERTGAKIGLLASAGFRDILEMGREIRYDVDDLALEPVPVLVPRHLRLDIPGRLKADGGEFTPLDEQAVCDAVRHLVDEEGIEALAIAFLHSYRNPAHELAARQVVRALYPDLLVSLSAEVAPEIREYERTNTTCVNAYVQPRVHGYLDRLVDDLRALGFAGELYIMLSSGGITTIEDAKNFPVRLIESGPAAGAMAAAHIARETGQRRVISFDMGGTTAKMCLVEDYAPHIKHDFEAGRLHRFKQGSGLPLKVTVVDMIEIGAGGGSIAGLDALGLLKVGPRSAGSVPGPVCYGRGGTEPTVTDADLMLGYLDPAYFLGGEMGLRDTAAGDAMESRLGRPLGIDAPGAARGIQAVVNESMAGATRMHLAENGKDPRDYTMIAFGGAGPVHAYGLAKLLKVRQLIVPPGAGVISAFGFLVAPPTVDFVRGYVSPVARLDWPHVRGLIADMADQARRLLDAASAATAPMQTRLYADMRYVGQGFEVSVGVPAEAIAAGDGGALHEAFGAAYRARFGRAAQGMPVEVVGWRLSASLPIQQISLTRTREEGAEPLRGHRRVDFPDFGPVDTAIYDRYALAPGMRIVGAALFEERESTFAVGPDCVTEVDPHGHLITTIVADAGTAAG
ncbi:hydantoinase/oxoprolinase family protein [Nitrospirillum bahiense]|uniref:N-methylhydantoinase A n=1 Tax=Nitrospirillum amazonense TaxID=28077 RepID=A0A560G733_9PROT|nr:hydantoinase/oxoprolinase family protein [Nitrospirillum amazonense]TWB29702.1 N-methylhydantoinase A [Nitrospirillum amazonense]